MTIETAYKKEERFRHIIWTENAVQVFIRTDLEWSNENTLKLYNILVKNGFQHFVVERCILHPVRDIPPEKHVPDYLIRVIHNIPSIIKLVHEISKLNKNTQILSIKSGGLAYIADERGYVLYKEEEP